MTEYKEVVDGEEFSFTDEDLKASDFDPADYIEDEHDVIEFINAALEMRTPGFLQKALGAVARSRGMTELSRKTGGTACIRRCARRETPATTSFGACSRRSGSGCRSCPSTPGTPKAHSLRWYTQSARFLPAQRRWRHL